LYGQVHFVSRHNVQMLSHHPPVRAHLSPHHLHWLQHLLEGHFYADSLSHHRLTDYGIADCVSHYLADYCVSHRLTVYSIADCVSHYLADYCVSHHRLSHCLSHSLADYSIADCVSHHLTNFGVSQCKPLSFSFAGAFAGSECISHHLADWVSRRLTNHSVSHRLTNYGLSLTNYSLAHYRAAVLRNTAGATVVLLHGKPLPGLDGPLVPGVWQQVASNFQFNFIFYFVSPTAPTAAPTASPTTATPTTASPTVALPCCETLRLNPIFCCLERIDPPMAARECQECGTK
jgi:hypothetical protein